MDNDVYREPKLTKHGKVAFNLHMSKEEHRELYTGCQKLGCSMTAHILMASKKVLRDRLIFQKKLDIMTTPDYSNH